MANDLDRISSMQDKSQQAYVTQSLTALQAKAKALYSDPQQAAAYFKMESDHLFETLAIREKIANVNKAADADQVKISEMDVKQRADHLAGVQAINNATTDAQRAQLTQQLAINDAKAKADQLQLANQLKLDQAQAIADKARLDAQLILISRAQDAENMQFQTSAAGASASTALITQITQTIAAMNASITSTNPLTQGMSDMINVLYGWIDKLRLVGHLAEGGAARAGQPYWVGEQGPELFWPTANGTVMPAATSAQLVRGASTVNNNQSTSYSMPIYTNNSPAALQQSFAVMRAGMI